MNEEEKQAIEEFKKQLKLSINIDDVTTNIRNKDVQTILNLVQRLEKQYEELIKDNIKWRTNFIIQLDKIDNLEKENKELKKNYTNIQESNNITSCKVTLPPEPQLPVKTLCESFSKKKSKNTRHI